MREKNHKIRGFTLVELVISLSVLILIILFSFSIYGNFFDAMRNLRANNLVYEESRFLMNRIVQEVRNNTVDYEEYFNQSKLKNQFSENYSYLRNEIYGQNYCEYNRQFYSAGDDGEIGTLDDQNTGQRNTVDPADGITPVPPAIGILNALNKDVASPIQDDLFLINVSGNARTYIKLIQGVDNLGNSIGQIGLLELEGKDFGVDHLNAFDPKLDGSVPEGGCTTDLGEGDGRIDTWICKAGYPCQTQDYINADLCSGKLYKVVNDPSLPSDSSFVPISPSTLNITDLKFIVSPMDDPRKAYRSNELQIQPNITIKLTAQAASGLSTRLRSNRSPSLSLDSTVSTRIYSEIVSECNLKQCNPGVSDDKSCPLSAGVCGPATPGNSSASQTCTADYLWSGCNQNTYQTFADTTYGLDNSFPGGARTFYENGLEYRSCEEDLNSCITGCAGDGVCKSACQNTANQCRTWRCNDGVDNDCSGAADSQDTACVLSLCSDGLYDPEVEAVNNCIDVGGACQALHPLQNNESACNDGLDNDCDGFADQFDADCVVQYCSNGSTDAGGASTLYTDSPVNLFLALGLTPKNYLFNATPADYAGTFLDECSGQINASPDISGICSTCLDSATGKTICECGTSGCTDTKVIPGHDYLASESGNECYDGLDNDCDGVADELDTDCQSTLCQDSERNCDLAPSDYSPSDYLKGYTNFTCQAAGPTINDESCINVGGLCEGYSDGSGFDHSLQVTENNLTLCQDGLDNDCDAGADWADGDGTCCAFNAYCLNDGGATFTDTLESSDYVGTSQAGITHNTVTGQISLSDAGLNNLSVPSKVLPLNVSACSTFDLSLNGTSISTPGTSQIEFMLSADNGSTFCGDDNCTGDRIDASELASTVNGLSGNSIIWRAFLSGGGGEVPVIKEVVVSYSNCTP